MVNITVPIPQELYEKIKKYPQTDWNKITNKAIADYIERLEKTDGKIVSAEKLAGMLRESNLDVSCVDLDKAIECYEKAEKM
jgi:hypothetical protein